MTKLLVPVDGSDSSDKAVRYALSIAKEKEDEILLLNVQPNYNMPNLNRFVSREQIRSYQEEESKKVIDHTLEVTKGSNAMVRTLVKNGDAGYQICEEAKNNSVDTIVMGHRGHGAVKRAILGSVAIQVLQDATCPVTIVR